MNLWQLFGYEANFQNSRMLEYTFDQTTGLVANTDQCVPNPGASNGRGVAFDPSSAGGDDDDDNGDDDNGSAEREGILFNTRLTGFAGDGLIRGNETPENGQCPSLTPIPFGEGSGPPNQDDVGALDFDPDNPKILYAAGYLFTSPSGFGAGTSQILYKVSNLSAFFDANGPPFTAATPIGSAALSASIEDITLDTNAADGGDDDDDEDDD